MEEDKNAALYLVLHTCGWWLDRPGNVISLCAACCAKFWHGTAAMRDDTAVSGSGPAQLTVHAINGNVTKAYPL
jgi:hypothetical protein